MLEYGQSSTLGLRLSIRSSTETTFQLNGATKSAQFVQSGTHTPPNTYQEYNFPLTEIPIWVSVNTPQTSNPASRVYATISLTINGDVIYKMTAGYIDNIKSITWPVANIEPYGFSNAIAGQSGGSTPAAGAETYGSLTGDSYMKLFAASFQLTTSATVANRTVTVKLHHNDSPIAYQTSTVVQTASTTRTYVCTPAHVGQILSYSTFIFLPLPLPIAFNAGIYIDTITANLQAGDQYTAVTEVMESFGDAH